MGQKQTGAALNRKKPIFEVGLHGDYIGDQAEPNSTEGLVRGERKKRGCECMGAATHETT